MSAKNEPIARQMWWAVEPVHAVARYATARSEPFLALGLGSETAGQVVGRAAAFGSASPELVASSFYAFDPELIRDVLPLAWFRATPQSVLTARLHAVDECFWGIFGEELRADRFLRAAELANRTVAVEEPAGRPIFAAHMALDWPTVPHLALWHAATLLREHRGDGHTAVLVAEGIDGCAANVLAAAADVCPGALLRAERGWSELAWADASAELTERGWLDDMGSLTAEGQTVKARIEARTDELAAAPYARLTDDELAELRSLLSDISRRICRAGLVGFPNSVGLPDEVSGPQLIDAMDILGAGMATGSTRTADDSTNSDRPNKPKRNPARKTTDAIRAEQGDDEGRDAGVSDAGVSDAGVSQAGEDDGLVIDLTDSAMARAAARAKRA